MKRSTCASGKRVGPFLLDGILGGEHEKRLFQGIGRVADRDLALLHRLEQGALHLGGRAVDLVGQEQVREDGSLLGDEDAFLLVVDQRADEVGGQQVRA